MKKQGRKSLAMFLVLMLVSSILFSSLAEANEGDNQNVECAHANTVNIPLETDYEQIEGNDEQHMVVNYYRVDCADCFTILEPTNEERVEESHSFDASNRCTACGYELKVECAHANTVNIPLETDYEQIEGNDEQHTVINYYRVDCADCFTILEPTNEERVEESHSFDASNRCTACGYELKVECAHANTVNIPLETDYEQIEGNDEQHMVVNYYRVDCADCFTILEPTNEERTEANHDFNADNVCVDCAYKIVAMDSKPGTIIITEPVLDTVINRFIIYGVPNNGPIMVHWEPVENVEYYTIRVTRGDPTPGNIGFWEKEVLKQTLDANVTSFQLGQDYLKSRHMCGIKITAYGEVNGTITDIASNEISLITDELNIISPVSDEQIYCSDELIVQFGAAVYGGYFNATLTDISNNEAVFAGNDVKVERHDDDLVNATYVCRLVTDNLEDGHSYRLRLERTMENDGICYASDEVIFKAMLTTEIPEYKISFITPVQDQTVPGDQALTLEWISVDTASYYKYSAHYLDQQDAFISNQMTNETSATIPVTQMLGGKTLQLWVGAFDANDQLIYAETIQVTTENKSEGKVVIALPAGSKIPTDAVSYVPWTTENFQFEDVKGTLAVITDDDKTPENGKAYWKVDRQTNFENYHGYSNIMIDFEHEEYGGGGILPESGTYRLWIVAYGEDSIELGRGNIQIQIVNTYMEGIGEISVTPYVYKSYYHSPNADANGNMWIDLVYFVSDDNKPLLLSWNYTSEHYDVARYNISIYHNGEKFYESTTEPYFEIDNYDITQDELSISVTAWGKDDRIGTMHAYIKKHLERDESEKITFISPRHGNVVAGNEALNLKWTPVDTASYYKYSAHYLDQQDAFISNQMTNETSATIPVTQMLGGKTLQLWVGAFDANDQLICAQTIQVTTTDTEVPAISFTNPHDGDTVSIEESLEVSWTEVAMADHYEFSACYEDEEDAFIERRKVARDSLSTTVDVTMLKAGKILNLWIGACDEFGNVLQESKVQDKIQVYTEEEAYTLTILSPNNGDTVSIGENLNITWTAVEECSYYEITAGYVGMDVPFMDHVQTTSPNADIQAALLKYDEEISIVVEAYGADGELLCSDRILVYTQTATAELMVGIDALMDEGDGNIFISASLSKSDGSAIADSDMPKEYGVYYGKDEDSMIKHESALPLDTSDGVIFEDRVTGLEVNGDYYIKAYIITQDGEVLYSEVKNITLRGNVINITSPVNGSTIPYAEQLKVSWTEVKAADHYEFSARYEGEDAPFILRRNTDKDLYTFIDADLIQPGKRLILWVGACDASGNVLENQKVQSKIEVNTDSLLSPEIIDFTITPDSIQEEEMAIFKVYTRNAEKIQLIVDGVAYDEYDVTNDPQSVERVFHNAGVRMVQFRAYGNGVWSEACAPRLLTVIGAGEMPVPEFINIENGDILLNNRKTVYWTVVGGEEVLGMSHYLFGLYRKVDGSWVSVNGHSDMNVGFNTGIELDEGLTEPGEYRIVVTAVASGGNADMNAMASVEFGYRTIPEFEITAIANDEMVMTPVTVNWNSPVWEVDKNHKPDKYVVWWYGPGIPEGKMAVEVSGGSTQVILDGKYTSVEGGYAVEVYAILGSEQRLAKGYNEFLKAKPEVTIDYPSEQNHTYLTTDSLDVNGTAKGGVTFVKIQLEENGDTMKDAAGNPINYAIVPVDENGRFSVRIDPVDDMVEGGVYAVAAYGYLTEEATKMHEAYVDNAWCVITVNGSKVNRLTVNRSTGNTWIFEGESVIVKVWGNRAMESMQVMSNGKTVGVADRKEIGEAELEMTASPISFSTTGKYKISTTVDGKAQGARYVYVVKHMTRQDGYVKDDSLGITSLPGSGSKKATVNYNDRVDIVGTYDSYFCVETGGKVGFVPKSSISYEKLVDGTGRITSPKEGDTIAFFEGESLIVTFTKTKGASQYKVELYEGDKLLYKEVYADSAPENSEMRAEITNEDLSCFTEEQMKTNHEIKIVVTAIMD